MEKCGGTVNHPSSAILHIIQNHIDVAHMVDLHKVWCSGVGKMEWDVLGAFGKRNTTVYEISCNEREFLKSKSS
jgi:hypothetical protein